MDVEFSSSVHIPLPVSEMQQKGPKPLTVVTLESYA